MTWITARNLLVKKNHEPFFCGPVRLTKFRALFRESGDINVFQNTPGLTKLDLLNCKEVTGKEDLRTVLLRTSPFDKISRIVPWVR